LDQGKKPMSPRPASEKITEILNLYYFKEPK
jgi:hypothetical protein